MRHQTLAIGLGLALTGCTLGPPRTLNTWTGEWEDAPPADETPRKTPEPSPSPSEGWQCDGQPCTPEQLQQLTDALEQ